MTLARAGTGRSAGATRAAWPAAWALWVAISGCATFFPSYDPFSGGGAESIRLDVENRNFLDATIYVMADPPSPARRIGGVGGNSTGTFQVPWEFSASMSVRIELLAGGSCTTAPLVVNPGDVLELEILPDFERTAYCM